MTGQPIAIGVQPHFTIVGGRSELDITAHNEQTAILHGATDGALTQQEDGSYQINSFHERLQLHLPSDATVVVRDQRGAIRVRGIAHVAIETAFGDSTLAEISGTASLRDITGDLHVRDCAALVLREGERNRRPGERRGVENVVVHQVRSVDIESVGGDLSLVGGQDVTIGPVGGSCSIAEVAGGLRVGDIGGSATIETVNAVSGVGNVGGDLKLCSAQLDLLASSSSLHIAVGGSAWIELPATVDVTVHAMAGGTVSGPGLALSGPGMHRVVYGTGSTQLHLIVGGDIELRGGSTPQATGSSWGRWANVGAELGRTVAAASSRSSLSTRHTSLDEQRRAVLQKVAEGGISPADADAMLAALGG